MKQKPQETLARKFMKPVCKLLGLALFLMLTATLAFQYLLNHVNFVDSGNISADSPLPGFPSFSLSDLSAGLNPDRIGGTGSGLINILLIGQDAREGEEQARSDSMILCTFNKKNKQLTMTSFLRDLYVQIPGHGSNRINAAYAMGGMSLLNDTLEQNFNLHIDGNVEVDFGQFSGIVDLLGGVEIELRQDEANLINREIGSSLTSGRQVLNGEEALVYSRIRKLDADGDFSRTNRQRKVIGALMDAYRSIGMSDVLPMVKKILPMITTDMNQGQILMCALEVLPYLSNTEIISQHIPADGTYTSQSIDGMSVLVADMDAAQQTLRQSLMGN